MSNTPFTKKVTNFVYKEFAGKPGKFLTCVGIVGWIASSISQTIAIITNDKIPEAQKKFLIPQEISDAIVNIISFAVITYSFTRAGEKLVESGKIASEALRNDLKRLALDKKVCTKDFNIAKLPEINELNPKFDEKFSKNYYEVADGVSFISNIIGSVISCNLVTPLLRNKIASSRQKASLEKDKAKQESIQPYIPVLPAQNRLGIDNYKKQASLNPLSINTSGSIKI